MAQKESGIMTRAELIDCYESLPPSEAFSAFTAAGIDPATVGLILGDEVADAYSTWGYYEKKITQPGTRPTNLERNQRYVSKD